VTKPATVAGQFMVDIDLSGMGQSPERFDQDGETSESNTATSMTRPSTRAHRPVPATAGPASIYFTDPFRDRYEAAAGPICRGTFSGYSPDLLDRCNHRTGASWFIAETGCSPFFCGILCESRRLCGKLVHRIG